MRNKKNTKTIIWIGVALLVLIAVLVTVLYLRSDRVGTALDFENHKRVQLTITQSVTYVSEIYGDDLGNTDTDDICMIKKDGTTLYESGAGEQYRYMRDGEEFFLYYDDFYGINADNGEWIEEYAGDYDTAFYFDFSVFENYKASDFKKVYDYYIPKENATEFFFDFFQITYEDKYYGCEMKFYFERGRLLEIVASYHYDSKMDIIETYKFTYENEAIQVPEADVRYDKNRNIIN